MGRTMLSKQDLFLPTAQPPAPGSAQRFETRALMRDCTNPRSSSSAHLHQESDEAVKQ
jgi:hypothetical protein